LDSFKEQESGKFQRLREICETIREKRHRVLVFTPFKEMTDSLVRSATALIEEIVGQYLNGVTVAMLEEATGFQAVLFYLGEGAIAGR